MTLRLLGALASVVLTACSMTGESARFLDVLNARGKPRMTPWRL